MKIRYIGTKDPTDAAEVTAFGITFPLGEWVDVKDPPAKLLGNPTFEVQAEEEPKAEPKSKGKAKAEQPPAA